MIKQPQDARFEIRRQGGPILNRAWYAAKSDTVVAISIDLKSKNCEVGEGTSDGVPLLYIFGNRLRNALYLTPGLESEPTEITFPDHAGWEIFVADICRYTLSVCLVKSTP